MKVYEKLKERGYIYQTTNEEEVKKLLNGPPTTVYVGIDPTGESLHIGHCFPLVIMRYLQEAGHHVIVLLGGATAQIGDPSGRNDMRNMVTTEFINKNLDSIKQTIGKFLKLDGDNPARIVNNADWYKGYDYVSFMRDIGVHFNVNKMLASESCKARLEAGGLTFFEMGYMLMQAYDFVYLNRKYGCRLEMGGSDQWGNIVAGAELGRKLNNLEGKDEEAFQAMTCPLLTNSEGKKMGKTEKGAVWVLKEKTSVYDFYQYFYNQSDNDVERLLKFLSRLSISEIEEIMNGDIRAAKRRMAYEVTKLVHGEQEAKLAQEKAIKIFSEGDLDSAPTVQLDKAMFEGEGINITALLCEVKLMSSKSEARRMIEQGAVCLNEEKLLSFDKQITLSDFKSGRIIIKKGKKNYLKVEVK